MATKFQNEANPNPPPPVIPAKAGIHIKNHPPQADTAIKN